MCVDLVSGEEFRKAIALNALGCKAFVMLLNDDWARSKECRFEFSIFIDYGLIICFTLLDMALRHNLKKNTPKLFPIVIKDSFKWDADPEIEGFLCSVNAIILQSKLKSSLFGDTQYVNQTAVTLRSPTTLQLQDYKSFNNNHTTSNSLLLLLANTKAAIRYNTDNAWAELLASLLNAGVTVEGAAPSKRKYFGIGSILILVSS